MKVLVIGAGGQGGPCASVLAKDSDVSEITLGDINYNVVQSVIQKIRCEKVKGIHLNANSYEEVLSAAQNMDVVIDLVIPQFAFNIMRAALKAGAHYVNSAFDTPFWDQLVKGEPLSLDKAFEEAGLTALLGCGLTPGITNVMIKYYCDQLDRVKLIKVRCGGRELGGENLVKEWSPGWSPKQALIDFATQPYVFKDSKYEKLPIFSEIEEYDFLEPLKTIPVAHHSHEEVYSIPRYIGKGIEYCDFKYYIDTQAATFIKTGFTPDNEILLNGHKIKPIDVLTAIVRQPTSAFIHESNKAKDTSSYSFKTIIEIEGYQEDKLKQFRIVIPNLSDYPIAHDLFGTSYIDIALPVVIGTKMCMAGIDKGILFPECLDPKAFIENIRKTGLPFEWEEV